VDATGDLVCAFKPQIAYFAAIGAERELERLCAHIRESAPQVPIILDAKRGDIGDTAALYAREAFERYGVRGEPAESVSKSLGMSEASIRHAKMRIMHQLREEIQRLREEEG